MRTIKIPCGIEFPALADEIIHAGFTVDSKPHYSNIQFGHGSKEFIIGVIYENRQSEIIIFDNDDGMALARAMKAKNIKNALASFHEYMETKEQIMDHVKEMQPLRKEISQIENATGIAYQTPCLEKDETAAIIIMSRSIQSKGTVRPRAFMMENPASGEILGFPPECKVPGSKWAVRIKQVKSNLFKAVSRPRLLNE